MRSPRQSAKSRICVRNLWLREFSLVHQSARQNTCKEHLNCGHLDAKQTPGRWFHFPSFKLVARCVRNPKRQFLFPSRFTSEDCTSIASLTCGVCKANRKRWYAYFPGRTTTVGRRTARPLMNPLRDASAMSSSAIPFCGAGVSRDMLRRTF
jgi:hypothetical protein